MTVQNLVQIEWTVFAKIEKSRKMAVFLATRVDPLTSILAVLARSCQILTTSWQPWIPWQDSYKDLTKIILIPRSYLITMDKILRF